MPLSADPARPDGRILHAPDGAAIARFRLGEREGRPLADVVELEPGVTVQDAVPAIGAELAGWRVAGGVALGRALVAAGATPRRHAHVMSRDLVRDPAPAQWLEPPLPAGFRLQRLARTGAELAAAHAAAYPPDHPDVASIPPDPAAEHDELIAGTLMGPLLDCSGVAVTDDGAVAAAIFVNATPGTPPLGGPWVSDIFRDPAVPGLGSALLRRALALATRDGLPALGLAVTHANAGAMRVYADHGLVDVLETFSVDV